MMTRTSDNLSGPRPWMDSGLHDAAGLRCCAVAVLLQDLARDRAPGRAA